MNTFIKSAIVAASMLAAGAAFNLAEAQTSNASTTGRTRSSAVAAIDNTIVLPGGGNPGGGGGGGNNPPNYQRVDPSGTNYGFIPPAVYAPSFANANPCGTATSAGVSTPFGGLTFGSQTESDHCKALQAAQMMGHLGMPDAAVERLCEVKENRDAMARANHPCVVTRQEYAKSGQPVATVSPTPVVMASSFDPSQYRTGADCLNAAPIDQRSLCAGKP